MTLQEFGKKHSINTLPVMNEEQLAEFVAAECIAVKMIEWKADVIEYYKNPDARLTLIKHIHGVK